MSATESDLARELVERLGGRFSTEIGIDVDAGDGEVERWFLAATLFGTRISTAIVERTARAFFDAGVRSITDAATLGRPRLVELLDSGGYARYDFRTADRLLELARRVDERHAGAIAPLGRTVTEPARLVETLDALPGWGPTTIRVFLRELRGLWPGAELPLDERTLGAAQHLRLVPAGASHRAGAQRLAAIAADAGLDRRDLECALVRSALDHRRRAGSCAGGSRCVLLVPPAS
jgi:hypothetical protein